MAPAVNHLFAVPASVALAQGLARCSPKALMRSSSKAEMIFAKPSNNSTLVGIGVGVGVGVGALRSDMRSLATFSSAPHHIHDIASHVLLP